MPTESPRRTPAERSAFATRKAPARSSRNVSVPLASVTAARSDRVVANASIRSANVALLQTMSPPRRPATRVADVRVLSVLRLLRIEQRPGRSSVGRRVRGPPPPLPEPRQGRRGWSKTMVLPQGAQGEPCRAAAGRGQENNCGETDKPLSRRRARSNRAIQSASKGSADKWQWGEATDCRSPGKTGDVARRERSPPRTHR